jgi:hypothetical protein
LLLQGWGTLGLANFAMLYTLIMEGLERPVALSLLLALLMGALFLLVGMWLTLQFRWVQLQYPAVVLAFERQVITAAMPVGTAVQAIGISSLVDAPNVPYWVAALMCLLYHQLGRPLVSSFHSGKQERSYGGAEAAPPAAAIIQVGNSLQIMSFGGTGASCGVALDATTGFTCMVSLPPCDNLHTCMAPLPPLHTACT